MNDIQTNIHLVDLVKEMGGANVTDEMAASIVDEVIEESRVSTPAPLARDGDVLPTPPERLIGQPCRCLDPDCTVPYGICHCGCGKATKPYATNNVSKGYYKGEYGLALIGHVFKQGTNKLAMPLLSASRRAAEAKATPRHTRPPTVSENVQAQRRIALYEAYYKDTKNYPDHRSRLSVEAAANAAGLGISKYKALIVFKELIALGCMQTDGPMFKRCILHPNTLGNRNFEPVAPEPKTKATPPTHEDMMTQVTSQQMADAIATAMWTRYEWALSEVGRYHEQVTTLTAENDRLRALLGEQPIDATEAARRILSGP